MRWVWLAVAVLLAVTAPPAAGQSAEAGPEGAGLAIRLLDAPTERRDDPRARVYIVDHVQPGDRISRRVEVTNGTGRPASVSLYAAASQVEGGSFSVLPGTTENDLTTWMQVTPPAFELAEGESGIATVVIDVPADAGGGERYAAVLAQVVESSGRPGIAVASRVGVRVYLSVGGEAEPASDFEISTLQAARQADGRPVVSAQVRNTGARALDLSGSLDLAQGPGGLSAGPFPAELGTSLAPGNSTPVTVVLDKAISGGPWTASITLRSGLLERRAEAEITFPDEAGEQAEVVSAKNLPLQENPNVLIPLAAGLIGLLALLLLLLRRRI